MCISTIKQKSPLAILNKAMIAKIAPRSLLGSVIQPEFNGGLLRRLEYIRKYYVILNTVTNIYILSNVSLTFMF